MALSSDRKTTALQELLITRLAAAFPEAALTGGAALAAFHLRQRATRDIDLFFHGLAVLDEATVTTACGAIAPWSERVTRIQVAPSFARLEATRAGETVVVDLVASPVPTIEAPVPMDLDGSRVLVDTRREILVNKLCALLGRSEIRDLIDVRGLLDAGESLTSAAADAATKDGGFSPLTLAWVLRALPVDRLGTVLKLPRTEIDALLTFRDELVADLVSQSSPVA